MPVLKHAKKKLRQDKGRTLRNKRVRELYKKLVKKAKENPSKDAVSAAFQAVDRAAKDHIIHNNKASRIKSSLSKLNGKAVVSSKPEARKTAKKKAAAKKTKKATKAPKSSPATAAK